MTLVRKKKIVIDGGWKYIKPISGPWKRKEKIRTTMEINSETFKSSVVENNSENETEYGVESSVKASWSVVDVEVSAKYNNISKDIKNNKIEETIKKQENIKKENEVEIEINLDRDDTIYIYKLIYENEGFYYEADATQIRNEQRKELEDTKVPPIIMNVTIEAPKFLKDINVAYSDDLLKRPDNFIEEVGGGIKLANINYEFKGKYVWLEPIPTYDLNEAAVNIYIQFTEEGNGHRLDLAKGDGRKIFRYLKIESDKNNSQKIDFNDIKLFRTSHEDRKPTNSGYTLYSKDINEGRGGDYLYLCWKTRKA